MIIGNFPKACRTGSASLCSWRRPASIRPRPSLCGDSAAASWNWSRIFDGDTYRAVYTVRFAEAVYVLHAFKKKSTRGIKTPQAEIELIARRLKDAAADHAERFKPEN